MALVYSFYEHCLREKIALLCWLLPQQTGICMRAEDDIQGRGYEICDYMDAVTLGAFKVAGIASHS